MTIRDNIARATAGGPPFRLDPSRVVIELDGQDSLKNIADRATEESQDILAQSPVDGDVHGRVGDKLNEVGFEVKNLENLGVIVASADRLDDVISNISNAKNTFKQSSVQKLEKIRKQASRGNSKSMVGGFKPGMFNFQQDTDSSLEAELRNRLSELSLHNALTAAIQDIDGVLNAEISFTRNTPGPRNLGIDPESRPTLNRLMANGEGQAPDLPDMGDAVDKFGATNAWDITRGEDAVIAIFDTSFCEEYFGSDRVIDTFSGDDVDDAFSAPSEGHGTMTAYAAAGNSDESGLPYNGVAPDADILLARLSDSEGALSHTEEAWNWLTQHVRDLDRPVFSNHSYGVPLCSGRSMSLCDSTSTRIARVMNQRSDHQAFYAAGNEGLYCGHRLSGLTNGINGINSDPTSIAVGALRFDLKDAQTYSSHGFGTCTDRAENPKPDVSCLLPSIIPYGCQEKDMSSRNGGSSGGTSLACPFTCGVGGLMGSVAGTAEREVIEDMLEETAEQPRSTQINIIRNHDARFGHGQVRAAEAVSEAATYEE